MARKLIRFWEVRISRNLEYAGMIKLCPPGVKQSHHSHSSLFKRLTEG